MSSELNIFGRFSSNQAFIGKVAYAYAYNRELTDIEAAGISANPWQIFKVSE